MIPIDVSGNSEEEVLNHIVMTRTKAEEKATTEKKIRLVSIPSNSSKRTTIKTNRRYNSEKVTKRRKRNRTYRNHRKRKNKTLKIHFGPNCIEERKKRERERERERERAPTIGDTNTPKNRHCLRGVDSKYIQWKEILNVLNGKLKIERNKKTESDSDRAEGKIEDDESHSRNYDTSAKDWYRPITTSPQNELNHAYVTAMKTSFISIQIYDRCTSTTMSSLA